MRSSWSLVVEILGFLNKFAPLCSLRCLVGPLKISLRLSTIWRCRRQRY